ncbi:hypothetical protein GCM10025864_19540 [Luteimicrobium album]|uniref:NADP-dependent oxidoreductase domain-containing protein n=1 Tax=Luteimicrobium album TaxID=1054550 RepID=A0ABQ6I330_9MICO|nr:aldo/keto reductase [Luteimicrobium album]GMA24195.1 hypothetical protein GCM10025864_19540 [Luteimicrobium album]
MVRRGSLRRLGVDHLDVLYLHQPDGETPLSETLSAVAGLQADGLVGELGVSNFAAWQIARVEQVCDQVGCARPVLAQQVYNLLARRIEDEYAGFARESGLATVVYNPLAGGLLVAPLGADGPGGSRFSTSRLATMYRGRYLTEPMVRAVRGLAELAADAGLSRVELALRWVDGQEVTTGVLLGASRPEQLGESLDALARGPLPQDVLDRCDAVVADVRGAMPAYNR